MPQWRNYVRAAERFVPQRLTGMAMPGAHEALPSVLGMLRRRKQSTCARSRRLVHWRETTFRELARQIPSGLAATRELGAGEESSNGPRRPSHRIGTIDGQRIQDKTLVLMEMEWKKHLISSLIGGICGTLLATRVRRFRRWLANR